AEGVVAACSMANSLRDRVFPNPLPANKIQMNQLPGGGNCSGLAVLYQALSPRAFRSAARRSVAGMLDHLHLLLWVQEIHHGKSGLGLEGTGDTGDHRCRI